MKKLNIVCVCKTGGQYSKVDVERLQRQVSDNMRSSYNFICLTDDLSVAGVCEIEPLLHNLPGWWSKLELFRPGLFDGPVLYLDLDSLVLKSIAGLSGVVRKLGFVMLRGFNRGMRLIGDVPASGVMGFHSDTEITNRIYETFMADPEGNIKNQRRRDPRAVIAAGLAEIKKGAKGTGDSRTPNWEQFNTGYRAEKPYRRTGGQRGDQGFIGELLGWDNVPKFQDHLSRGYIIGKKEAILGNPNRQPPAHVVAWSGKPTLVRAATDYPWIRGLL